VPILSATEGVGDDKRKYWKSEKQLTGGSSTDTLTQIETLHFVDRDFIVGNTFKFF